MMKSPCRHGLCIIACSSVTIGHPKKGQTLCNDWYPKRAARNFATIGTYNRCGDTLQGLVPKNGLKKLCNDWYQKWVDTNLQPIAHKNGCQNFATIGTKMGDQKACNDRYPTWAGREFCNDWCPNGRARTLQGLVRWSVDSFSGNDFRREPNLMATGRRG
jgi:hypothetical protein